MSYGSKAKSLIPRKVVFEHYAPQAKTVQLAGDFNGWNPARTPLCPEGGEKWKVSLELLPGRYEYRYWVDGNWQNEQHAVECVPNPFGTWNCVIEIQ